MIWALLSLFCTGFVTVFMYGFQSRAVNSGAYALAFMNSFLIGIAQVYLWKTAVDGELGLLGSIVYGLSGSCGIVCAMKVYAAVDKRKLDRRSR